MSLERFVIPFSQSAVDDLRDRVRRARWPDEIPASGGEYGFDLASLQDLCRYWADDFDWKAQVEEMSALCHYRFDSGSLNIHFIHERGKGRDPIPLILTHGWPGSFLEMARVMPLLTESFDVVVPSLPGFGFSDRPNQPGMNVFRVAELWVELMSELGYPRFAAQGGDLGAGVSTVLGLRHPEHILGIHLNYIPGSFRPYRADPEHEFARRSAQWSEENGAYAHIQRTRPQTLAYGLNDSPVGLAAWMLEKFREWSDSGLTRDELLSNVTLYWMTGTINSSFRMYYENRKTPLHFGPGDYVSPPCAFAHFPKEIPTPPRDWVERGYNIQRWTEMPRGGHFAAAEEPELLAEDIGAFFRNITARPI